MTRKPKKAKPRKPKLKEIEMIDTYAKRLFESMHGADDYPYESWEEQRQELVAAYTNGHMSKAFLEFAST